jgi:hypothetical protein
VRSFLVALLFVAASVAIGAQASQLAGTWKMNLAKTKYTPGPTPQSETVTYESSGQGVAYTVKGVDTYGEPTTSRGTIVYDGKDYPVTGSPDYDTVATKRVDDFTGETTRRKAGKVVQTVTRVVSKDGKTLTLTTKGVNADGKTINNVAVYDKQ